MKVAAYYERLSCELVSAHYADWQTTVWVPRMSSEWSEQDFSGVAAVVQTGRWP